MRCPRPSAEQSWRYLTQHGGHEQHPTTRAARLPGRDTGRGAARPCAETPWPWGRQQRGWDRESWPLLSREAALGSAAHAPVSHRLVGVPLPPGSLAEHRTEKPRAKGAPGTRGAPQERLRPAGCGMLLPEPSPGGQSQRDPEVPCAASPAQHPLPCPWLRPAPPALRSGCRSRQGVDIIFS